MSHRHSDSKRRHSKFDREPSPKRYRRDGKQQEKDRDRNRVTSEGGDHNQRNPPPPPHHSRREQFDAAPKKSNSNEHHDPPKHSFQPSRSHSYHQHDEQGSTEQVGQSSGQREYGEKVFAQSKENNERVDKSEHREQRDEKSQMKLDDNVQKRDGFTERKDDPTVRKRRAFREKKIPVDSKDANPPAMVAVKSSHAEHPLVRNERKEERSSNPHHQHRPEKQIAEDRAPNKNDDRRDVFSSRPRYGGSGGNSNYRGRDKFNGGQGYRPMKTRIEKWKHDLYQEVNKDPITKNEDDQIAKLEALLAS